MHPANLLSILDTLAQEVDRVRRIDYAVNNVTTHKMFPADVKIVHENRKLSILQDDKQVAHFHCASKTNLLAQIAEVKQTLGLSPREFILHRMRNEG